MYALPSPGNDHYTIKVKRAGGPLFFAKNENCSTVASRK
jgi:hypothetical protein